MVLCKTNSGSRPKSAEYFSISGRTMGRRAASWWRNPSRDAWRGKLAVVNYFQHDRDRDGIHIFKFKLGLSLTSDWKAQVFPELSLVTVAVLSKIKGRWLPIASFELELSLTNPTPEYQPWQNRYVGQIIPRASLQSSKFPCHRWHPTEPSSVYIWLLINPNPVAWTGTYFATSSTTGHTYDQQSLFGLSLASTFTVNEQLSSHRRSESHPDSRIYACLTCLNMPTFFSGFFIIRLFWRQWVSFHYFKVLFHLMWITKSSPGPSQLQRSCKGPVSSLS